MGRDTLSLFLDTLGWLGFGGLMTFYWMIGKGRTKLAYYASSFGAAMFLIVGIFMHFGYFAKLPSLPLMEAVIIALNIRSIKALKST
jgi:cytochrome b subunit of formate dehydrogenase